MKGQINVCKFIMINKQPRDMWSYINHLKMGDFKLIISKCVITMDHSKVGDHKLINFTFFYSITLPEVSDNKFLVSRNAIKINQLRVAFENQFINSRCVFQCIHLKVGNHKLLEDI